MTTQKNLGEAVVHVRATVHGMKDLNDLRNVLQNFGNGLQGFSGNMGRFGNSMFLAAEASRTTLRNMRHLSFAMRDAGRQALGFAAAVAAGFAPIVIEGARFEQAVANVRSVMAELREDTASTAIVVTELSNEFIRLGEISEFTNVQVAEAAHSLALAGFSATELKNALPVVVDLASASGTELARTAEIVANVARAFNFEAENFSRVGDILTQTFTNSNTTLESLAETMKLLAPTASAMGLSLEEAATAAGILGNAGVRGCYDGETEVLTSQGWVRWDQATTDHVYATVNSSHQIEYHSPLAYIKYHYDGKMYQVRNRSTDLLVTPNHNMYVMRQFSRTGKGEYELYAAEDVFGKPYRFLNAVENPSPDVEFFEIAGIPDRNKGFYRDSVPAIKVPMDLWLEFLGYYLSEGSYYKSPKGDYKVYVSQNKESKAYFGIAAVLEKLRTFGFSWKYFEGNRSFRTHDQQLYQYVSQFGHSTDKFVPDFVFKCSQRQIRIFLNAYREGDGDFENRGDGYSNIYTSSRRMADDISRLAILAGYGTSVKERRSRMSVIRGREIRPTTEYQYAVCIKKSGFRSWNQPSERNRKQARNTAKFDYGEKWVDYSGYVYCVEVPNNTLIIRRNGRVVVCGNSLAGTGFSRVLNQLREEADTFDEVLQDLGSSFDKIDLSKNSLVDVIREFERLKKISNEDFLGIAEIFDERAARAFINLINQGADNFERLLKLNQESAGVAEAVRNIRLDTLAGDFERLKSNFQSLLSEIFVLLKPRLREIVQGFLDLVDGIRQFARNNPAVITGLFQIAETLIKIVAPLGLILLGFGKMMAFVSGFYSLGVAISSAQAQFALLQSQIAATTAQTAALQAAMARVTVAAAIFRTTYIAALVAIVAVLGVVIASQITAWLNAQADAAHRATDEYKRLNAELSQLSVNAQKQTTVLKQQADDVRQAIELLQKGRNLTEKDFKDLQRLTGSASGFEINQVNDTTQEDFLRNRILELQEKRNELIQAQNNARRQATATLPGFLLFQGQARSLASEIKALDEQLDKIESDFQALVEERIQKTEAAENFKEIAELFFSGNKAVQEAFDAAIESRNEIDAKIDELNVKFRFAIDDADRLEINKQLNKLLEDREALQNRLKRISPLLGQLPEENFWAQANGDLKEAIRLFEHHRQEQIRLRQEEEARVERLEELREAEKKYGMTLEGVEESIKRHNDTLQGRIDKIEESAEAQLEYLAIAEEVAKLEGRMADQYRIAAAMQEVGNRVAEDRQKLIDEAIDSQNDTVDGLRLEQAERQKNFAEFDRLSRRIGQAKIDREASEQFQLTGDPAVDAQILARQKEFIRLKKEELDTNIKNTKSQWDEDAKRAADQKAKAMKRDVAAAERREDIEKDVLKHLAGQAKSAQELAYFLRLIHNLEKQREAQLFRSQRKAFQNAEQLEALDRRRAKLEAEGEDTSRIDRLIRRQKQLFLIRDALLKVREKEQGISVGGTGFDPDTISDTAMPTLEGSINSVFNSINDLFSMSPKTWVDSFLSQWSVHAPRLQSALAGLGNLNLNGAVPSPVTASFPGVGPVAPAVGGTKIVNLTVNNRTDLAEFKRVLKQSLNSEGFRV